MFRICYLCIYTWTVKDTKAILNRSSHSLVCARNEGKFKQQQQLLLDISSAYSIYIMYGSVAFSSEDAWYNGLGCFLSYFTNLSKVKSLLVSNFGLLTITSFCSKLFYNIYVFNFTPYIKHEKKFMFETHQIFFLINRNTNARRTERYKHEVKFTITFYRKFVTYSSYT